MNIPLIDLTIQHHELRNEINAAIQGVLDRADFILGQDVAKLEEEFAAYCGVKYAIGVDSGLSALELSLRALGIGPGDEVVVPTHTFTATAAAVTFTGAKPIFVDADPETWNIDVTKIEAALTPRTKAILPVHLYGLPVDMHMILGIAEKYKLLVVEDACQAHGAKYKGKITGSLGNAGGFSFYPTKNLGAIGDGGAVVTNSPALAEKVQLLRQYGWKQRYISQIKGMNSRLDELQAGFLRVKLRHLEAWNQRRRQLASLYMDLLSGSDVTLPPQPADVEPVFHQFVIRHPKRDALRETLRAQGIHTVVHYPHPIHLQPGYVNLGLGRGSLPNSEQAADEVLSLPMYPELTEDEVRRVADACLKFS